MPLKGFNRKILTIGFKKLFIKNKGLKKLIGNLKKKISYQDIGFKIGPLINSSGRMAKADDVVELFLTQDDYKINSIIDKMNSHNLTRKRIEQENLDLIDTKRYNNKNVIFIFNKEFHEGIIGIIAAKLSQIFNKPCFVVTESQNLLKCSIRSQSNIKINRTINKLIQNKLIISGGGHDEAGGFSAKKELLSDLEEFINKEFENLDTKNYSYFDTFTIFPKKNSSIISDLKSLEPFGKSNPEPIFYFKNIKSIKSGIINRRHVQNILKNKSGRTIKSISFDCVNSELGNYLLNFKKEFDLIGCIFENNWNNKKKIELRVIDIILKS
jgi:single-stranded-DNA-specific exonuclease